MRDAVDDVGVAGEGKNVIAPAVLVSPSVYYSLGTEPLLVVFLFGELITHT